MHQHKPANTAPASMPCTGCLHCRRTLTYGEITEMWCDACKRETTPVQVKPNGRLA